MYLQIAAVCDSAYEYGSRLCMLGTFDTIEADALPVVRNRCAYVFQIRWDKQEQGVRTVRIEFTNEQGEKTLKDLESTVLVEVPADRKIAVTNFIINLDKLTFGKVGLYCANVIADGQCCGTAQLQVVKKVKVQSINN